MIDFDKMTDEQKVFLAAGPKNVLDLRDTSKINAKVAACAPTPRPTPNLTRDMVVNDRPQKR